jgi:hypothetical protein
MSGPLSDARLRLKGRKSTGHLSSYRLLSLVFSVLVDFNQSFSNGVFYQVGQAL